MLRVLEHGGRVQAGNVHAAHGPAAIAALADFLVVQQFHIGVVRITQDGGVQAVHLRAAAFQHLHEDIAAVAQRAGDAVLGVVGAGMLQDVVKILQGGIGGTAYI